MLDNFGMGEFLMLALFALLFFGPERLPQIGAQLGRWLSRLTQYSKAFMTQWTEEAAAVQGAVQDVMSIRDEIRAAQVEIAESLNAAQQDINETIAVAKGTIQQATPTADGFLEGGAPALANAEDANRFTGTPRSTTSGDDSEAVSRTQDIVSALLKQQGITPPTDEQEVATDDDTLPVAASDGSTDDDAPLATDDSQTDEDKEARPTIQEIIARSTGRTVQEPAAAQTRTETEAELETPSDQASAETDTDAQSLETQQPVVTQPDGGFPSPLAATQQAQTEPATEKPESAFEKTQRILNQLMGVEPEEEQKEEPESGAAEAPAQSQILPATHEPEKQSAQPPASTHEIEVPIRPTRDASSVQHVQSIGGSVSTSEFTKLSIEVTQLRRELLKLRQDLQSIQAEQTTQAVAVSAAVADAEPGNGTSTDNQAKSTTDSPVEDVA